LATCIDRSVRWCALCASLLLLGATPGRSAWAAAESHEIRVAVASSFSQTAGRLCRAYFASRPGRCVLTPGASGLLASQIAQDARRGVARPRPLRIDADFAGVHGVHPRPVFVVVAGVDDDEIALVVLYPAPGQDIQAALVVGPAAPLAEAPLAIPKGFSADGLQQSLVKNLEPGVNGLNGTTAEAMNLSALSGEMTTVYVTTFVEAAAGDTLGINAWQSSGGALNLNYCRMAAVRYAPAS